MESHLLKQLLGRSSVGSFSKWHLRPFQGLAVMTTFKKVMVTVKRRVNINTLKLISLDAELGRVSSGHGLLICFVSLLFLRYVFSAFEICLRYFEEYSHQI